MKRRASQQRYCCCDAHACSQLWTRGAEGFRGDSFLRHAAVLVTNTALVSLSGVPAATFAGGASLCP